jgi:hypothetical protein
MIDWHGLPRNRSTAARSYPTCPPTPVAMDIKEINSKVTESNQLEFFIGGLRDDQPAACTCHRFITAICAAPGRMTLDPRIPFRQMTNWTIDIAQSRQTS